LTTALQLYESLLAFYGDLHWWPASAADPQLRAYEIIVGAVLTQNTAWRNVEKALSNFGDKLTPQAISSMEISELSEIIRPAGFFNQKASYLKAVTEWFSHYHYDVASVQTQALSKVRMELLSTKGVGHETADAILLYAFDYPTFVVDAYTFRLCQRIPINAGNTYSAVKLYFESNLPQSTEVYKHFHALIVQNAKEHCLKKPNCTACPIAEICRKTTITLENNI